MRRFWILECAKKSATDLVFNSNTVLLINISRAIPKVCRRPPRLFQHALDLNLDAVSQGEILTIHGQYLFRADARLTIIICVKVLSP